MNLLMTPDNKKVKVDMSTDLELYEAPRNPANTGTRFTSGTDLYAHKTRKGNWFYYQFRWSMWQGTEDRIELIEESEAKDFILEKVSSGNGYIVGGVDQELCERIWGNDFFEEDA